MEGKKKEIGFRYAFNGLREVFKSEKNFRVHLLVTLIVVGFGLYMHISAMEWLAIVIVIGLVLSAEILNTAIEEIINYLKPEIHPTAKKIKDIAAAGVFVAAVSAVVVGLIIFIPKLI
ncbi:diacylglycerol kinase family protein [Ornithinibacillus scapharcae]|uniref:diacylglycerol kinase family protein n=1 Tax=Ornithinibacillus scapharcae TaxID=1147159 RepID=UPI000225B3A3|nr:diacylglycerol kinase family protein [Ornithinibacillus scapharcae]